MAWGYRFGWCVVLAINGPLVGAYLQAKVHGLQHTDPVLFPKIVETAPILVLMRLDYAGVRTGRKVRYVMASSRWGRS